MPLLPFTALVYDDPTSEEDGVIDLSAVVAPLLPGSTHRSRAYNVAQLMDDHRLVKSWMSEGWLTTLSDPAMYIYKIGGHDINGEPMQWTGVFAIAAPANGLLIAPTLVPVAAEAFTDLLVPAGMPLARATGDDGNHHRVWALNQTGVMSPIADAAVTDAQGLVLAYEAGQGPPSLALGLIMGLGDS